MDLSTYSDEDLEKIAESKTDLSSTSNEELLSTAGINPGVLKELENMQSSEYGKKLYQGWYGDRSIEEVAIEESAKNQQAKENYAEYGAPAVKAVNTALFDLPRRILEKYSPESAKQVFPDQKTFLGQAGNVAGQVGGFIAGGPGKIGQAAVRGASRIPGMARAAGQFPRIAKTVGEMGKWGVAGASMTPEGFINVPERAKTGAISAISVPVGMAAGKFIAGISKIAAKGAVNTAKSFGVVRNSLKQYGDKIIKSDFVRTTLAPKAEKMFAKSLAEFKEPMQKFVQQGLRIKKPIVQFIAQFKPKEVAQMSAQYGDDVANVVTNVDDVLVAQEKAVGKLYDSALGGVPQDVPSIKIDSTMAKIKQVLKLEGWLDNTGNPTMRATMKASTQNKTMRSLFEEFMALRPGKGMIQTKFGEINVHQWKTLRDQVTQLYKVDPNKKIVVKNVLDTMHREGQRSGLKGIMKARSAFTKYLANVDDAASIRENSLKRVFSLDQRKITQIQRLEKNLGVKILDPSKHIMANQTLHQQMATKHIEGAVLGEGEFFARQLDTAMNAAKTGSTKKQMLQLLGDKKAISQMFKDLEAFNMIQKSKTTLGRLGWLAGAGAVGGQVVKGMGE